MQGFKRDQIAAERFLNLRYDGTDVAVMTSCSSSSSYSEAFASAYKREFGFVLENRSIKVTPYVKGRFQTDTLVACNQFWCLHTQF